MASSSASSPDSHGSATNEEDSIPSRTGQIYSSTQSSTQLEPIGPLPEDFVLLTLSQNLSAASFIWGLESTLNSINPNNTWPGFSVEQRYNLFVSSGMNTNVARVFSQFTVEQIERHLAGPTRSEQFED